MSRNVESRFATNPTNIDMSRSKFKRFFEHKTTMNVGDLVPFYVDEVLPGDTFQVDTSKVVRLQTPLTPFMDNLYLDTYYFFVPNRIVWEHWKQFMGENTESAWLPTTEYSVPQITSPEGGWSKGTIADYMGIPIGVENLSVNALPFRAYAQICQDWFRDENLTDPLNIPINDSNQSGTNGDSYINDVANGGACFKVSKYHDYFTSALPAPQKGPDVSISLANVTGSIPVVGNGYALGLTDGSVSGSLVNQSIDAIIRSPFGATQGQTTENSVGNESKGFGVPTISQLGDNLDYSGLIGDLSGMQSGATLITINELRQAFQIQKFYEKSARGGTRYIEILKSMFGVTSPDARLQRPEYLGGNRIPINVNQVVQTSESGETPQGNTAAFSLTTDYHSDFTHSFVEHGFVIGLVVARYDHTYQQGIEKFWNRSAKFDYYWPLFANLGEQAILNQEIYAQGNNVINQSTGKAYDKEVFGYQEAWADYRYKPSRVSGEMRSTYTQSLDIWHLGDDYSQLPSLSDDWIREDKSNVDRVLAVSSSVSDQMLLDIAVSNISTRAMPVYSIPGLIDHH